MGEIQRAGDPEDQAEGSSHHRIEAPGSEPSEDGLEQRRQGQGVVSGLDILGWKGGKLGFVLSSYGAG